jgi:hypothetical protein
MYLSTPLTLRQGMPRLTGYLHERALNTLMHLSTPLTLRQG